MSLTVVRSEFPVSNVIARFVVGLRLVSIPFSRERRAHLAVATCDYVGVEQKLFAP